VGVKYSGTAKEVKVSLQYLENDFETLWGKKVTIILPITDKRKVVGGTEAEWKGRVVWEISVA